MRLPTDLVDRFTVIREIPVTSGEADLLLVAANDGSGKYVVKVYRRGLALDPHVLGRILEGDQTLVVQVCEFGESDERWWELQGYVEAGSLADLVRKEGPALEPALVASIAGQLNEALHHLHVELDVVHRDMKPANVLVLSRDPLRLVLSDFGLATVTGFSLRAASGSGTPLYFPPEVVAGFVGGRPRDYWALGMMVAEMAIGRHPFAGLQPATITHHLGLRPVDLSAVEDDRLNLLCRGLLVRDPDNRWGYTQMRAWVDGETPSVQTDAAAHASAGVSSAFSGFTFLGRQYGTRQAVASALAGSWAEGARLLAGTYQRQRVVNWLAQFHNDEAITDLLDSWDQEDPTPDRGLAQLLVALNHELASLPFRGYDLAGDGLDALATEVVNDRGRGHASEVLQAIHSAKILTTYSQVGGHEHLAEVDREWRAAFGDFAECVDSVKAAGAPHVDEAVRNLALARLLIDRLNGRDGSTLAPETAEPDADARLTRWFRELDDRQRQTAGSRLALQLLAPVAVEQANALRYDEERQRSESLEREQEEAARQLRQRMARTRRCLVPVVVALVLAIIGLTFLSSNVDDLRGSARTSASVRWVDALANARVLMAPYGALALAGAVLARWSTKRTFRSTWYLMQLVCLTGSLLLPVLLPFTARFYFESKRRYSDPAQPDRRLRPLCLLASWSLCIYALFLGLESRYGTFTYLLGRWSPETQRWYQDRWPTSLDMATLAATWGWTVPVAILLALVGVLAAIRSYHPRQGYERVTMQVVLVVGMVTQILTVGGWLVATVASWFVIGYVAVVIFAVVGLLFMIAALWA